MDNDEGKLSFQAGLDYSPIDKDVDQMVEVFEKGAVKINDAFNLGRSVDANKKQIRDMISTTKAAIRELEDQYRNAMRFMKDAGGFENLSDSEKEWLDRLKDGIRAAKEQVKGLQENLQELNQNGGGFVSGLTSGLQGLMGAYTAASGILARFNADQSKLEEIQTKLQSSMSILMGLQQVYNTLQSTSAFRLQVVTKLTEAYSRAQAKLAAASGLTKVAIGGLVAVLAAAIGALVAFSIKQREAFEDSDKLIKSTAESAAAQLTAYRKLQIEWDKANGSLEKQKELLKDGGWDELGLAVNDVNDAEAVLVTNSQSVIQSYILKAKAAQLYAEAQKNIEDAATKDLKAEKIQRKADEGKISLWRRFEASLLSGKDNIFRKLFTYSEEGFKNGEYVNYGAPSTDAFDKEGESVLAQWLMQDRARRLRRESEKDMEDATSLLSQASDLETQAQDLIKAFGGKVKDTAQNAVAQMQRELSEVNKIISRGLSSLDDYEVELIDDEDERSLQAMRLSHARKLEEMENEQREMEEAYRKMNALTGAANVDEETGLTAEQAAEIQRYTDMRREMANKFAVDEAAESAKTFNTILKEYRGFGAQYVAITEDYMRKKAIIAEGMEQETDENIIKEAEDALEVLEADYSKSIANLARTLADSGKDIDFTKWVRQLADMNLMDLQIELQTKTDDLDLYENLFPEETEKVEQLKAAIALLNEMIDQYSEKEEEAASKDKWTELASVINIVREAISDLGDAIGGAFGEVVKSIGDTMSSMAQLVNAAKELEENPASITAKYTIAATAIQNIAGIIGTIVNQVKASKEAMDAWGDTLRQCAHEYAMLQIESKEYEQRNIFGVENPYQRAIASANAYAAAIEELQKKQAELYSGQVQTGVKKMTDWESVAKNAGYGAGAGAAIGTAIGGWAAGLGTLIGGAIGAVVGGITGLFTQKVVPIMESLTSQYGQLFDPSTYKLNPQLLADYDKLDDDTKAIVDNWDDIVKKAEEARKEMESNFTDLAGDIGSQLSNALVNAFTDGDIYAAVDDFHDYTTNAIQSIIEQMIFSQAFGDLFDELEKKFNESFLGDMADQNLVDDLIWFNEEYKKRLEEYNAMMSDAQEALGDIGFDLWDNSAQRKAATRSSLGASQDSIDESNARLTTIQAHTYELNENVRLMREQSEELRLRTTEILAEVMGIHNDTTAAGLTLAEMMAYMKEMRMDISTIVDKGVTILG